MGFNRGAFQSALGGAGGLSAMGGGAAAVPWYLAGGVLAANCVGAYRAQNAPSLAASYANLANPAAPLTEIIAPTFAAATGWTFTGTQSIDTGITPTNNQTWSMLVSFSDATVSDYLVICGVTAPTSTRAFQFEPNFPTGKVAYFSGSYILPVPQCVSGVLGISGNAGFRNGAKEIGAMSAATGALASIYIGASHLITGGAVAGITAKVQALAIYNTTLTDAQVLAISNAMSAFRRQIIFDGDSLTAGQGASAGQDYPSQLVASLGAEYSALNLGVNGQTIVQMSSDAATQIDTRYNTHANRIIDVWGGINDIYGGASGATAYTNLVAYHAARRAVGFKTIAKTLTKAATVTGGAETERVAFNTALRADHSCADGFVDYDADARFSDTSNTTYFNADGVHFTDVGYCVAAELDKPALMALL